MTMATEKILVQDGETIIELKGADKEAFLADREAIKVAFQLIETEYEAKKQARINALAKIATIAGLTEEELNTL